LQNLRDNKTNRFCENCHLIFSFRDKHNPEATLSGIDLEHVLEDMGQPMRDENTPAVAEPPEPNFLTAEQMRRLDAAFAAWVAKAKGKRSVVSRNRARLVFLLLRYTGAKLGEILAIDDRSDFVLACRKVLLGGGKGEEAKPRREVYLPGELHAELKQLLRDPDYALHRGGIFHLDQGYMRRVIYDRAGEAGILKNLANPNTLRRSRAVELLHNGVPLTVVQRILGHLTANSTATFLDLPEEEQKRLEKHFLDRENRRSAGQYNTFFGKIAAIEAGEIQTRLVVRTLGGHQLTAVISTKSLETLGLRQGGLATARVKGALLTLATGDAETPETAQTENRFRGVVERVMRGADAAEVVVALADGTRLCATLGLEALTEMRLGQGDGVWVATSAFSVIIAAG
jgi:molybdate transport system regulatory protein